MERVLITGANRGIGLALARHYLARGDRVFAAVRRPDAAADLRALETQYGDRLLVVGLDVRDADSLAACVEAVRAQTAAFDILLNNAGINPEYDPYETFGRLEAAAMLEVLHTNSVAPLLVAQAFYDLLKRGTRPRIANFSSDMGSLTWKTSGGSLSYCASKAALNMLTRGLAPTAIRDGVIAIALDPGWVQTDMGGPGAEITPDESAMGIINVLDNLTRSDAGRYLNYAGDENPW